jgi:lipopolysaccharide transport system permease protein
MTGSAEDGAAQSPHVYVIDARRGGLNLDSMREVWTYREVLWAFILRRLKVRYRHSIFGVAWVILQPLAFAAVFAVFLGRLARLPAEGVPYFLFALSGLALWSYFATTVTIAIDSLLAEAGVLKKVYFPRELPPIATVVATLVDAVVALGVLLIFAAAIGRPPTLLWLLIPLPVVVVAMLATGIGLLLAGFNVYYRDVAYGLPFLIQIGFFLSPIIYSTTLVPLSVRGLYDVLNPLAASIQALRDLVLA